MCSVKHMAQSCDTESNLTEEIRDRSREEHKEFRRIQRSHKYNVKRLHLNDLEKDFQNVTTQEMIELTNKVKKSCKDLSVLRRLKQGFGESDQQRETFIRTNGAVHGLVSLLSGHDANVQLESAACLVNLLSSEHKKIKSVVKQVSSYLVLYLQSDSDQLKELCAFALGNICADSIEYCNVLKSQGFVSSLLLILEKTHSEGVIVSSLFALGCYMANKPQDHREILESGFEKSMVRFLSFENRLVIVETAKILFYLSTRREFDAALLVSGVVDGIVYNLNSRMEQNRGHFLDHTDCQMLTFFVRTLAALCSDDETVVVRLFTNSCYNWNNMIHFLLSVNYEYLVKESLWFLCNVASYKTGSVVNLFINESLLRSITSKLFGPADIIQEAIICLCNILELNSVVITSVLTNLVTNETTLRLLLSSNKQLVANTMVLISLLTKTGLWISSEKNLEVIRGIAASDDHDIKLVATTFLSLFHL